MAKTISSLCAAVVALGLPLGEALADDTGVAQLLHSMRREGKRLCLESHFHTGSSAGAPTKKAAEVAAVKAWAEFTAWEYGTDWAQWVRAGSKKLACAQSGASWGCEAEARACK